MSSADSTEDLYTPNPSTGLLTFTGGPITPLSGIPPAFKNVQHELKSPEHAIQTLVSLPWLKSEQQILIFHTAKPDIYKEFDYKRDCCVFERRKYSQTYHPTEEMLIIRFPLNSYSIADAAFAGQINRAFKSEDMAKDPFIAFGQTTWLLENGIYKEARGSWCPRYRMLKPGGASHPDGKGLPSVVLEIGAANILSRLRVDAAMWLTLSYQKVKAVIVFAIEEEKSIIIEKIANRDGKPTVVSLMRVDRDEEEVTPGGTEMEEEAKGGKVPQGSVQPDPASSVTHEINSTRYTVTGGPLVLENDELFGDAEERKMYGDNDFPERDAVFGDRMLAEIASRCLKDYRC